MNKKQKESLIISYLRNNARMSLTDLSKKTGIPVSTLFDKLKQFEESYSLKYISLLDFQNIGYNVRAIALINAKEKKHELMKKLSISFCCNTLLKINNGWDFLAELIFKSMNEAEGFLEKLEEEYGIHYQLFYTIEKIQEESFFSIPELANCADQAN